MRAFFARYSMVYSVKEAFLTLQGEGRHAGRAAVFCRFSGCNLWTGREEDRARAVCGFCDTDFVGVDGENGGKFSNAEELVAKARYYLSHASERIQIAAAGQSRLLRLGLSWRDHVCREWKILEKILSGGELGAEDDAPFWPGFRQGRLPEQTKTAIATDEHG